MITGRCTKCGEDCAPGKDQAAANRNLGLHMRAKHGVNGKTHSRYRKSTRGIERLAKPRSHKRKEAPIPVPSVQPCVLDHCPNCGSRFYVSVLR